MTAKANPHWYPRHYKDYQLDTSHLSMLEHGAYTLLLDHYYLTGKPLMTDIRAVARQMRCMTQEEIDAVKSILEQFFTLQHDGWHNKRADDEIARRSQLIEKKQRIGKLGADAKWQKDGSCHSTSHTTSHSSSHSSRDGNRGGNRGGNTDAQTQTQTHTQETKKQLTARAKPVAPAEADAGGSAVWSSYRQAYVVRYGVEPVRNAKNNALCKQLIGRLGSEAADVAAFFVNHSGQFYVLKGHPLTLLVSDAEKLRTEWATGRKITATAARAADRQQNTGDIFTRMIAEKGGDHAER